MADKIHSTGRGGAGNIVENSQTYVDGDIVREAVVYDGQEYSGGRGGAGNMALPASGPVAPKSEDVIPEPAFRTAEGHDNFHTGRGGQGNIHRKEFDGHSNAQHEHKGEHKHEHNGEQKHEGLLEKAKHAIGLDKKEKS